LFEWLTTFCLDGCLGGTGFLLAWFCWCSPWFCSSLCVAPPPRRSSCQSQAPRGLGFGFVSWRQVLAAGPLQCSSGLAERNLGRGDQQKRRGFRVGRFSALGYSWADRGLAWQSVEWQGDKRGAASAEEPAVWRPGGTGVAKNPVLCRVRRAPGDPCV